MIKMITMMISITMMINISMLVVGNTIRTDNRRVSFVVVGGGVAGGVVGLSLVPGPRPPSSPNGALCERRVACQ